MELLLNLAWLLLAVPAFYLWRSSERALERRFGSLQCVMALGCVLVMLFPVVSATDDLHAMRSEMEESQVSKRSLRQAGHEKSSVWNIRLQSPPALLRTLPTLDLRAATASLPSIQNSSGLSIAAEIPPGRAPPTLA